MNECLLALCLTLFSDFGTGYGAEVSSDYTYMRLHVSEVTSLTNGFKIDLDALRAYVGTGSLIMDNDTYGLNFIEAEVRYTLENGLYARVHQQADTRKAALGLSITF